MEYLNLMTSSWKIQFRFIIFSIASFRKTCSDLGQWVSFRSYRRTIAIDKPHQVDDANCWWYQHYFTLGRCSFTYPWWTKNWVNRYVWPSILGSERHLSMTPTDKPYFQNKAAIIQCTRTVFRIDTLVGTKYNLYKGIYVVVSLPILFDSIWNHSPMTYLDIVTGFAP